MTPRISRKYGRTAAELSSKKRSKKKTFLGEFPRILNTRSFKHQNGRNKKLNSLLFLNKSKCLKHQHALPGCVLLSIRIPPFEMESARTAEPYYYLCKTKVKICNTQLFFFFLSYFAERNLNSFCKKNFARKQKQSAPIQKISLNFNQWQFSHSPYIWSGKFRGTGLSSWRRSSARGWIETTSSRLFFEDRSRAPLAEKSARFLLVRPNKKRKN